MTSAQNNSESTRPLARVKPSRSAAQLALLLSFSALAFLFTAPPRAFAAAADIYLANSAQGTGDGSSCANAKVWTFFNTTSNWGTGTAQIGPGTTVHLCGTITGPSGGSMTFHGSGTSGSPITLRFESGAVLQSPSWGSGAGEFACPCTGALTLSGLSNIVIDGGGTPTPTSFANPAGMTASNGIIQNTANGTNFGNQSYSPGIYIHNGTNITVQNLVIQKIYQHTNSDPNGLAPRQSDDILVDGTSSGINIKNNVLNGAGKGVELEGSDSSNPTNIAYNYVADHCWHIWVTDNTTPNVFSNEITNWDNWNTNGNDCHTDGIMAYGGPTVPYIYNNYIHGSLGTGSPTAFIYCTYPTSGDASHCTIFNNLLVQDEQPYTRTPIAFHGGETGPHFIYNNTIISASGSAGALTVFTTETPEKFTWINNLTSGGGSSSEYAFDFENGYGSQIAGSDYNLWFNLRNAVGFPEFPGSKTFSQWKSTGFDTHSIEANPLLTSSFPFGLQTGSPAIGAGENLTSLCTGRLTPLCKDRIGNSRPASGGWDIGAMQLSQISQTQPNPPTGLSASVQ